MPYAAGGSDRPETGQSPETLGDGDQADEVVEVVLQELAAEVVLCRAASLAVGQITHLSVVPGRRIVVRLYDAHAPRATQRPRRAAKCLLAVARA